MLFTSDITLPRNTAAVPLWVETLEAFLVQHEQADALHNRVHHLLGGKG